MKTEMGEYIVGAYLKLIEKCDFVNYNERPPEDVFEGLAEIDVVGLNFSNHTTYLCEVTTCRGGLLYGSGNAESVERIGDKFGD